MLFPLRQTTDTLAGSAPVVNGSFSFQITREFFLDSLLLKIPVTCSVPGAAPQLKGMGLIDLIKNVNLTISDGSNNRAVVNASGGALVRRASTILNGLDIYSNGNPGTLQCTAPFFNYLSAINPGILINGITFLITIPLLFKHPQLSDPIGSATMLPLPRYNANPVLTVQLGGPADILNSGTLGVTFGTPRLVNNKRQVDNVSFPTIDIEFKEIVTPITSTGTNIRQKFDIPGSYTAIDIYTTDLTGLAGDLSGGGIFSLQYLSNVLRQFQLQDLKIANQYSMGNDAYFLQTNATVSDLFPGYYHLDFLHDGFGMEVGEMGSLLNTNLLAGSGAELEILQSWGALGNVAYASERFFGDLSPFALNIQSSVG